MNPKNIQDVKMGDEVWVVISGLTDRNYFSPVLLYPNVVKARVSGVVLLDSHEKGDGYYVLIDSFEENTYSYRIPAKYKIYYTKDDLSMFPQTLVGHAELMYSDFYDDVYTGGEDHDYFLRCKCVFSARAAKKLLIKERELMKDTIKASMDSHKKHYLQLKKSFKDICSTVERQLHSINTKEKNSNNLSEKK